MSKHRIFKVGTTKNYHGGDVFTVLDCDPKISFREMREDYVLIEKKVADKLVEALNFYTKHPIYWDKDQNGNLLPEGPSQVAINAIREYEGKTYSIDLDIQNFGEVSGWEDRYGFLNYDVVTSEGSTLEEILDNAWVWTTTQDGDSGPDFSMGDLSTKDYEQMEAMLTEKFKELVSKEK